MADVSVSLSCRGNVVTGLKATKPVPVPDRRTTVGSDGGGGGCARRRIPGCLIRGCRPSIEIERLVACAGYCSANRDHRCNKRYNRAIGVGDGSGIVDGSARSVCTDNGCRINNRHGTVGGNTDACST